MREAISEALSNNHYLKAAASENSAAELMVSATRSGYLPQLLLEESGVYTNSPTKSLMMRLDEGRLSMTGNLNNPASSSGFQTSLLLEQPLFDRRIGTALSLAKNEQEASKLAMQKRREEIAYKTVTAYLDVQKTKTGMKLAEAALAAAREHQRLTVVRSGAGIGLRSDELRARTFVSEMEQQLITAGNSVEIARLRLARVVGRGAGEKLDATKEYSAPSLRRNQAELLELAFVERAELKEMQKQVERADLGVVKANDAYWPTLQAMAAYQMNDHSLPFGRDNDSWITGATFRWRLFDGGRRSSEGEHAVALRSSAYEYLADMRHSVALQVTESYLHREELGKKLEVARHSLLEAEEVARLLSKRYENSLALMVELLDAQTMLNRARTDVAWIEAEYAKSWAHLLFVTGRLLKEIE